MFVVKITYLVALDEIDKYVQSHRDFLDEYYKKGLFLVSGPMNPRVGGIIVANGKDKDALMAVLENDPYNKAGIANYEVIEFSAVKYQNEVKAYIEQ